MPVSVIAMCNESVIVSKSSSFVSSFLSCGRLVFVINYTGYTFLLGFVCMFHSHTCPTASDDMKYLRCYLEYDFYRYKFERCS